MCLNEGGGDLSASKSMMLHEQGRLSGPLLLAPWPSSCRLLLLWLLLPEAEEEEPTKTRCHKLLDVDVCGR